MEEVWNLLGSWLEEDPDCFALYQDWIITASLAGRLVETRNIMEHMAKEIPRCAAVHYGLGTLCLYEDLDDETLTRSRRAFERGKRLTSEHESDAEGYLLFGLGTLERFFGNYETSLKLLEDSFDIFAAWENSAGQGYTLNQFAFLHRDRYEYAAALEYAEKALERFKVQDGLYGASTSHFIMGTVSLAQSRLEPAETHFAESLRLAREQRDHQRQIESLIKLGNLHYDKGQAIEAQEKYGEALKLCRNFRSRLNTLNEALILAFSAYVEYEILGNYQKAFNLLEESENIFRSIEDWTNVVVSKADLANLHLFLGDYDAARDCLDEALDMMTEKNVDHAPLTSFTLKLQGFMHSQSEDPDVLERALEKLRQAEKIDRQRDGTRQLTEVSHLEALTLFRLGRDKAALALLDECLSNSIEQEDELGTGIVSLSRGEVHEQMGNLVQAEEDYRRAAAVGYKADASRLIWTGEYRLGLLQQRMGSLSQAEQSLRRALDEIRKAREWMEADNLRWLYMADKHEVYCRCIELLQLLSASAHTTAIDAECFRISEEAHARALLDLLREARIEIDPPERTGNTAAAITDISTVQATLHEGEYLLEYLLGEHASFLFLLSSDQDRPLLFELPPRTEIEGYMGQFLEMLKKTPEGGRPAPAPELLDLAGDLHELLLTPALAHLAPGTRRLIFVPDGILHYLPFEVLVSRDPRADRKSPDYLIKKYEVAYVQSASVLIETLGDPRFETRTDQLDLLAFGDPDFGGRESVTIDVEQSCGRRKAREWPIESLYFTAQELDRIAKSLRKASVFKGVMASKSALQKEGFAERFRVLHLATHTLVDEINPECSAVVFTLNDRDPTDGLLHLDEIFGLRLRADLVVLSSCNTGRGKPVRGEGVVGISRAFFSAGARSIVHSLWPVEDVFVPDFMTAFYNALARGESKIGALRQAKLEYLSHESTAHPHYWASFVLLGDYGDTLLLHQRRIWPWIICLFLLAVLVIVFALRSRSKDQRIR